MLFNIFLIHRDQKTHSPPHKHIYILYWIHFFPIQYFCPDSSVCKYNFTSNTHTHIFEVRLNGFVADFSHWMLSRAPYNTEPPRCRAMHMRPIKLHFFFSLPLHFCAKRIAFTGNVYNSILNCFHRAI